MLNNSIPVDAEHVDGGNEVDQVYCGALLVNELDCAPFMAKRIEVI
jgi:hypothetical protein